MESLEMLANNLANTSTPGYKKDSESYSLYLSDAVRESGGDADPVTATLPVIEHNWNDFSQGPLDVTANPLDLALTGSGFFTLQGPNGPLYTRAGHFQLAADGTVTSPQGYPLLLNDGTALRVDSPQALQISSDGQVTQNGQTLGQLGIVSFGSSGQMARTAGAYYASAGTPQAATNASVMQGSVEGSNVNAPESAVRLMDIMRQFEMLTKAVQINADMNSKATNEVARVVS
jgi:flagellar basal body rod protein FlgG